MTHTFTYMLDTIETALSDLDNSTWTRNVLINWAKEAMWQTPILRPKRNGYTVIVPSYTVDMDADFREMVCVEYPVDQVPPVYLLRLNRMSPEFYLSDNYYDIDYNYADGRGYILWFSGQLAADTRLNIDYMANHDTTVEDNSTDETTIQDEHLYLIVAYCVMKAYRERLSNFMQDPTAYSQIVNQMVASVQRAEEQYRQLVKEALNKLAVSRPTTKLLVDDFDRIY